MPRLKTDAVRSRAQAISSVRRFARVNLRRRQNHDFCSCFTRNPPLPRQIPGSGAGKVVLSIGTFKSRPAWSLMTELAPRHYPRQTSVSRPAPVSHFGGQPVFIGAAALAIIVLGIGSMLAWRSYTGTSPEL